MCFYRGHEKSYLDLFSDSLFIFRHSITLKSSAFIKDSIVLSCVLSLKDGKVLNNVVSSAYIINLKSFIYDNI